MFENDWRKTMMKLLHKEQGKGPLAELCVGKIQNKTKFNKGWKGFPYSTLSSGMICNSYANQEFLPHWPSEFKSFREVIHLIYAHFKLQ